MCLNFHLVCVTRPLFPGIMSYTWLYFTNNIAYINAFQINFIPIKSLNCCFHGPTIRVSSCSVGEPSSAWFSLRDRSSKHFSFLGCTLTLLLYSRNWNNMQCAYFYAFNCSIFIYIFYGTIHHLISHFLICELTPINICIVMSVYKDLRMYIAYCYSLISHHSINYRIIYTYEHLIVSILSIY